MDVNHYDERVNHALGLITAGGHQLVMVTRRRVASALDALDAGDFREALAQLGEAANTVSPLARAAGSIGIAGSSKLVRVADLEEGMELAEVGVITGLESSECGAKNCPAHVKITVGGGEPFDFHGDQEVFVSLSEASE